MSQNPKKVLFVCLGNICRSPLVEGVFKKYIDEHSSKYAIIVDSAGTASYHVGDIPDSRATQTAQTHNITLEHTGRSIQKNDFLEMDFILVMDHQNLKDVNYFISKNFDSNDQIKAKVSLLREFDTNTTDELEVADPYYGGASEFEKVYEIALRCAPGLMEAINVLETLS
jgi:protein-tyrosine phosphatase